MDSYRDMMEFDGAGRVGVRITAQDVDQILAPLQSLGLQVIGSEPDLHFVEGFLPTSSIIAATGLSSEGLMGILPIYQPITSGVGSYTDQAGNVLESDRALATSPGYDGTGVKVGVLSDSYNNLAGVTNPFTSQPYDNAANDVAHHDLPGTGDPNGFTTPVQVVQDYPYPHDSKLGPWDEGRAMLQLVHHTAPGASLYFATADTGESQFATNIQTLANDGCKVIVDDVTYLDEPFFQDGIVAKAVNNVVSNNGVSYFSAAGNNQDQAYDSGSTLAYGANPLNFVTDTISSISNSPASYYDFDPTSGVSDMQKITIKSGQGITLSLQWDQPFYTTNGVTTNLDIFLLNDSGKTVAKTGSNYDNIATQTPWNGLSFVNTTGTDSVYDLVIQKAKGTTPGRIKYVNFSNGSPITFNTFATNSPTICPHAAAANAMAVAAAPYFNQRTPESFSSYGPATILFDQNGNRLASAQVRAKPDITSIDGTDTSFFPADVSAANADKDNDLLPNYFGTSAAAPHAAAVAALLLQEHATWTPAQVYTQLKTTADPNIGGTPGNVYQVGAGLIDAYRAVVGTPVPATVNVADGFESGVLGQDWEVYNSGSGRTQVTSTNSPEGSYQLVMDGSRWQPPANTT